GGFLTVSELVHDALVRSYGAGDDEREASLRAIDGLWRTRRQAAASDQARPTYRVMWYGVWARPGQNRPTTVARRSWRSLPGTLGCASRSRAVSASRASAVVSIVVSFRSRTTIRPPIIT